ncbi:hypothetical protein [Longispora albida]|uniref:hypothetical protein n=1 Tax=Longispora albida TaxID=203523 RepID=UPI0003781710|nr:hypothetical protein [Longispora albida]
MLPLLSGRIQTRLFLLALAGSLVTLLLAPLLPGPVKDHFLVLGAVALFGVGWELVYHLLMQFRWEKDWPTLFGLVTAVPEGLVVWLALRPEPLAFCLHFGAVWLAVWLLANGPMRVPFLRWRFRGGRLL